MKKRIFMKIQAVFLLLLMLTSCNRTYDSGYISYIAEFGPNETECHSFYHYISGDKKGNFSGLRRYDLITNDEQDIYIVEDSQNQSISNYYGDDNEVYFVVTTTLENNDESVLFHYELNSNEYETLFTTDGWIGVFRDIDTNKIKVTTKEQNYYIEDGCLQAADIPESTVKPLYAHDSSVKLTSTDGTVIEINKKYKNTEFTYTIGNSTGVITALSDYDTEKSGVSQNFIIEDDKIFGIVQITKGKGGITPTNYIESGDLKKELLVCLDYKTGESEVLYNTKNKSTRIIGYSNNKVYLLKNQKVICKNLSDGNEKEISTISYDGDGQLVFYWIGSNLVIYDHDNYQVIANIQT